MANDFDAAFQKSGFLADAVQDWVHGYRTQSAEWFAMADEISDILQEIAVEAMIKVRGTSFERDTVSTMLFLRGLQNYQGAVVVAERGMIVEARILVRSMLEGAFALAGLHDNPDLTLDMIRSDDTAARKGKAKTILKHDFGGVDAKALNDFIAGLPKGRYFSPEEVSQLGPLKKLYLLYKQLSDDAAHPSATSMKRHMNINPDRKSWSGFKWGPNDNDDIRETLVEAMRCAIPMGVAVTQMFGYVELNEKLGDAAIRFRKLDPALADKD